MLIRAFPGTIFQILREISASVHMIHVVFTTKITMILIQTAFLYLASLCRDRLVKVRVLPICVLHGELYPYSTQ